MTPTLVDAGPQSLDEARCPLADRRFCGAPVFPFPVSFTRRQAHLWCAALGPWAPNIHLQGAVRPCLLAVLPVGLRPQPLATLNTLNRDWTSSLLLWPASPRGNGREGHLEVVEEPDSQEEEEQLLGAHRVFHLLEAWPQDPAAPGHPGRAGCPSPRPRCCSPRVSSSRPPGRAELFHPPRNQSSATGVAVSRSADKATCPWRKPPPARLPGRC